MSDMLDQLRASAMLVRAAEEDDGVADRLREHIRNRSIEHGWERIDEVHALIEMKLAERWIHHGSVTYELTHSMAALFALTSAPRLDWTRSPYPYFLLKIPRKFFPLDGVNAAQDTWILAGPRSAIVVPDHDTTAVCSIVYQTVVDTPDDLSSAGDLGKAYGIENNGTESNESSKRVGELCGRFLANTIAYITEHRESLPRQPGSNSKQSPTVLRPPSDVVITKEFRDAASAVVAAKSIVGTRRALAHVVRGHWRNQPVGPGRSERRLTWVRPHKRGDESLGKVVARIERIYTKTPPTKSPA